MTKHKKKKAVKLEDIVNIQIHENPKEKESREALARMIAEGVNEMLARRNRVAPVMNFSIPLRGKIRTMPETEKLAAELAAIPTLGNNTQPDLAEKLLSGDKVNHPVHYNLGKIECIEFLEDQKLGFHLGNAIKYIVRAGKKDFARTQEDLDKAVWYIRRYQESMKPESERRRPNEMPQERA